MSADIEALRARIEKHLSEAARSAVTVRSLVPLSGGACQDNVRIDASVGGADERLVLRSDARTSLPGSLDRAQELAVIEAAVAAGVRTPRARFLAKDLVRAGANATFLDWAEGEALGRRVVAHPSLEKAREALPRELVRELAKIHSVRPRAGLLGTPPADPVEASLAHVRSLIAKLAKPRPALDLILRWLDEHRPRSREVTLVHGDFRTGNFLVTPAGLSAVLDWEFAHWGSPLEDLAWLCLRDWRFGRLDRAAGGIFARALLYQLYSEESGRVLDPEDVRWWEVFGNLRWAAGSLCQGLRGETEGDIELLAIARRAAEMEYEALRLIAGPAPALPPLRSSSPVLDAVARFLEEQAKPALKEPALAYRAVVAASLLRSVALEQAHPPRFAEGSSVEVVRANLVLELRVVSPRFDPEAKVD